MLRAGALRPYPRWRFLLDDPEHGRSGPVLQGARLLATPATRGASGVTRHHRGQPQLPQGRIIRFDCWGVADSPFAVARSYPSTLRGILLSAEVQELRTL